MGESHCSNLMLIPVQGGVKVLSPSRHLAIKQNLMIRGQTCRFPMLKARRNHSMMSRKKPPLETISSFRRLKVTPHRGDVSYQ
eukprot:scaffold4979_cov73-Cylindrotheca_fusiformis.AAC.3